MKASEDEEPAQREEGRVEQASVMSSAWWRATSDPRDSL